MERAFAEIAFNESSAAEANLAILQSQLSPKLWERLPTLLAQLPSPDDALNFLERYLREAPASGTRHLEAHPTALHYLLSLFKFSRREIEDWPVPRDWPSRPSRPKSLR
ncbi:MAG: hypothetical protein WBD87_11265 [Candidatus Acidiferrales bacterium]